ncbi:MAG TPA: DNA polymerase ligase N-terminal domain-containing protein [Acidobacteriota bacterium]|nr:DNA polymerase ligase N-terminal domain-containing protein [Acidobacteriota bacterium]
MTKAREKLQRYGEKRNFDRTTEPKGEEVDFEWAERRPIFVIQHHDASTDHFDFRLEVEGVLKSWSVPKGPSTDPSDKRLAIPTEDHPLEYADFEGVIPEGEYGGGTVMVWDRGSYRNLKQDEADDDEPVPSVAEQLEDGHATVWLEGEKIRGGYALIRTGGEEQRWLLIKMDDQEADARRRPTSTEPKSVKTGRTMKEIRKEEGEDR